MEFRGRIFPLSLMLSIFLFSLIHLGVSIGIIVDFRKYGDIFRPQIGLSGYNIAISFFGLLTGVIGLLAITLGSKLLKTIAFIVSGLVGIMALASLVTAIIINAKSFSYVRSHFTGKMMNYMASPGDMATIDNLQNHYSCCGANAWIDWANAKLDAASPTVNKTTVMTTTMMTTTTTNTSAAATNTTTMSGAVTTNTPAAATDTITTNTAATATDATKQLKRDVHDINDQESLSLAGSARQKRQASIVYGGIYGLPLSFGVTLPYSCCTAGALLDNSTSMFFCISNANGAVNHFYSVGCVKAIQVVAGNQAMGFGVINSFLVALAFVAMPVLLLDPSGLSSGI
ncbi:unnamed protein product [Rotaria socialis]|uniref:Tetraspanin n=1 Tax=Rotaria socialis TaxID=392032 RepID=A0A818CPI6_9BILA|nr:unnamed protein product [Rotaria socialis]CAF3314042.1 unnamed protein product [Rotaria socialis]CAF3433078.1 unnamed protein product [Rotaria socialis]CAF3752823.1 unnamed protein product [Rotaria socialis]CAF4360425.1 unnamed protein product [Rotaria socialis]